jgi:hypothetical protein
MLAPRCLAALLLSLALGACEAEFPDGSPYRDPIARIGLDRQVAADVGAIVEGMRQAHGLRPPPLACQEVTPLGCARR